jgi:hypothetical protein
LSFLPQSKKGWINSTVAKASRMKSQATARYMACKLIWSPAARDDLHDIVRFIARDNPERAESFG